MKKKLLTRINLILGSAVFSLMGLSACYVKYGCPPEPDLPVLYGPPTEDTVVVVPEYGVPAPQQEMPAMPAMEEKE